MRLRQLSYCAKNRNDSNANIELIQLASSVVFLFSRKANDSPDSRELKIAVKVPSDGNGVSKCEIQFNHIQLHEILFNNRVANTFIISCDAFVNLHFDKFDFHPRDTEVNQFSQPNWQCARVRGGETAYDRV